MVKRITFFLVFLIAVISCGQRKTDKSISTSSYKKVTEEPSLKEYAELIEYKKHGDTITIVSTDKFLYYPFGSFNSAVEFEDKYDLKMDKQVESSYPDGDTTQAKRDIYKYIINNSYIKFLLYEDQKKLEVLSGKIYDKNICLVNGVKLGIDKENLIHMFVRNINQEDIENVNVVELESGLTGIWHYYTFKDNILIFFCFDSDYQLPKD